MGLTDLGGQRAAEIAVQREAMLKAWPAAWRRMAAGWAAEGPDAVWLMFAASYLGRTQGTRWAIDPVVLSTGANPQFRRGVWRRGLEKGGLQANLMVEALIHHKEAPMETTNYDVLVTARLHAVTAEMSAALWRGEFAQAERLVAAGLARIGAELLAMVLTQLLMDKSVLTALQQWAGRWGYHYERYQQIPVHLPGGHHLAVRSPWFAKAVGPGRRKRGPKRRGAARNGAHLALAVLGCCGKLAPGLAWRGRQYGALCPSFAVASRLLAEAGLTLSEHKLRDLFSNFAGLPAGARAKLAPAPGETVAGKRVVLSVDGGRVRDRVPKAGRIPAGKPRHGYRTPGREPELFTIYVLDAEGKMDNTWPPVVDGSLGGVPAHLDLLRAYLEALDIAAAAEVNVLADGAPWIWMEVPALLQDLGVAPAKVVPLLDYSHAKSHLHDLLERCQFASAAARDACWEQACNRLYQGDLDGIYRRLWPVVKGSQQRGFKRKFAHYFGAHPERFQYAAAAAAHRPLGSGCIESAIRRVLNLRLKSPDLFWKAANVEAMIFLRAQLLDGRWAILKRNWLSQQRLEFTFPGCAGIRKAA